METGTRGGREVVGRVLEEKEFISVRAETIVSLVHESGALDRARNLAQAYAQRAKACLNGRPNSEYARALATLPTFILDRRTSSRQPPSGASDRIPPNVRTAVPPVPSLHSEH